MVLITNINKDFQNIATKVLQMAQKVAQMTSYIELSQNWYRDYFRNAEYEYESNLF